MHAFFIHNHCCQIFNGFIGVVIVILYWILLIIHDPIHSFLSFYFQTNLLLVTKSFWSRWEGENLCHVLQWLNGNGNVSPGSPYGGPLRNVQILYWHQHYGYCSKCAGNFIIWH